MTHSADETAARKAEYDTFDDFLQAALREAQHLLRREAQQVVQSFHALTAIAPDSGAP